ncbi:MFS transporter [Persephonella sp.]
MRKVSLFSWTVFDFAETVFSANIISVFFPLWVINTLGGSSYHYSFVYSASIFISILLGMLTGKIADEKGYKDLFFKFAVVSVVVSLSSLYFIESLFVALVTFFFMNLFYQQSLIFYNSLLFDISSEKNRGFISGIGVGIGYIGGVVSLLISNYLADSITETFLITAAIFSLFVLPSVIFLKSQKKAKKFKINIRDIIKDKPFLFFILSILFLTDAAHGLIIFMSIYLNKVLEFSQDQIVNITAIAGIFAIISAPVTGYFLNKISPAKFFQLIFLGWFVTFIALIFSDKYSIYLVAISFGILLASLWTTMRIVLISISPEHELTTRFAFMALSERMASIISPVIWGVVILILGETAFSYKVATFILSLFPLVGFIIYRRFLNYSSVN